MGRFVGFRGLVLGVRDDRSLATAIGRALTREGAEVAATGEGAAGTTLEWTARPRLRLDVRDPSDWDQLDRLLADWEHVDGIVHAIAAVDPEALRRPFVEVDPLTVTHAFEVSVLSFLRVAQRFATRLERSRRSPSLVALSYLGAQHVVPNYHVMGVCKAALESAARYLAADLGPRGIRVNIVSSGPVLTQSAATIPGFRQMVRHAEAESPLRRRVAADAVASAALFLLSEEARDMTGEVLTVDCGLGRLASYPAASRTRNPEDRSNHE